MRDDNRVLSGTGFGRLRLLTLSLATVLVLSLDAMAWQQLVPQEPVSDTPTLTGPFGKTGNDPGGVTTPAQGGSTGDDEARNDQPATPVSDVNGPGAGDEFAPQMESGKVGNPALGDEEDLTGLVAAEVARVQAEAASAPGETVTTYDEILKLRPIENILGGTFGPESICLGRDELVAISTAENGPWRWNCKLVINMPDGDYVGTGFLIGDRTVITAGHCVHGGKGGQWATSIEVIPGMTGERRPFGTFISNRFRSVTGWVQDGSPTHDYGAIILNEDVGARLGYFGFAVLPASDLNSLLVNTSGYPADLDRGLQQYYGKGRISPLESRQLKYMIDTYGGQSGSAVYRFLNGERHVVGIHAYGGCPNGATRITPDVFENLKKWKAEQ